MELKTDKMNFQLIKIISIFSILISSLSSCTTVNGDNQNSGQQPTPNHNKFISGRIQNNKYYAMDGSFSINLPFKKGTVEYDLMEIGEFYYEKGKDIAFGPFGKNKSMYYIQLIRINQDNFSDFDFEETSFTLSKKHFKSLAKYSVGRKKMDREIIKIKGNTTIHWNFVQLVNTGKFSDYSYGLTKHHIFTIRLKHHIAFIMVQKASNIPDGINFKSAYDFAFSLSLLENSSNSNSLMTSP